MRVWRLCNLRLRLGFALALIAGVLLSHTPSYGASVRLAVASNFTGPMRMLAPIFEAKTGHRLIISYGSTGQLFAQISRGAPFDVFLAADLERPEKLINQGKALAPVRSYAVGRLVLYPARDMRDLQGAKIQKFAMANPKTAPYGQAAQAVIQYFDLWDELAPKIVRGGNIAQAFQFIETGNADQGLLALSQMQGRTGRYWLVPKNLHPPIHQGAVRLRDGAVIAAFWAFLFSLETQKLIEQQGYGIGAHD